MTATQHRLALPAGYQLGKYQLRQVLGAGGFGITYLADDASLGRRVAIKELLPNDIATRLDGTTVVAKTVGEESNLAWARERFLEEGRALAACDHTNVVNVYEMLEANGTAYMVTKFEEGRSLAEWLRELGTAPTEAELRGILSPLLSGLEKVHRAGFLHRDLKPENIYITDDGRPILLDFGSARQAVSDRTTSLTSIVTSGYAPFEQYHEDGKQGAWSDIYAMAAVIYRSIHGKKPPEATRRLKDDPCPKLAKAYAGKYSARFLSAIDRGLSVEAKDRPQSIAAWREELGSGAMERDTLKISPLDLWKKRAMHVVDLAKAKPAWAAGAAAGALLLIGLIWKLSQPAPVITKVDPTPAPAPVVEPTPIPIARTATPVPHPPAGPTPFAVTPATPSPNSVVVVPPNPNAGPKPGDKWQNSLGMNFLPLPGNNAHLAMWATRRGDFEAFVKATGYDTAGPVLSYSSRGWKPRGATWNNPGFFQNASHPVVGVNAYDAVEFCRWLTEKERSEGILGSGLAYRLPTDSEWSAAAGDAQFAWGNTWPPPEGVGNFASEEARKTYSSAIITKYHDGFTDTAPTGTFPANALGFFDLGSNVREWVGTWNPPRTATAAPELIQRGAAFCDRKQEDLRLDHRTADPATTRALYAGFRCILAPAEETPALVLPALEPKVKPIAENDENSSEKSNDSSPTRPKPGNNNNARDNTPVRRPSEVERKVRDIGNSIRHFHGFGF